APLDVDDEAHAARVVLVARVVQGRRHRTAVFAVPESEVKYNDPIGPMRLANGSRRSFSPPDDPAARRRSDPRDRVAHLAEGEVVDEHAARDGVVAEAAGQVEFFVGFGDWAAGLKPDVVGLIEIDDALGTRAERV